MSVQITTAFVAQYRNNVLVLAQQKGSKLRDTVRNETDVVGKSMFFERLGATAAVLKPGRHADTPLVSTPHSRRMVTMASYEWADLIDQADKVRLLINPESDYAINGANAMGRAIDDVIISAALGNAFAGEDGLTVIALPAGQIVAENAENLTLAKLTHVQRLFGDADIDTDEPKYLVHSPAMLEYLLTNVAEVKSSDYNTVKALINGEINTFMGFTWIQSTRLFSSGAGHRTALAFAKTGMGLAIGADIKTSIDKRPDKSNSIQVFLSMDIGATRIEDEKVISILCTE